MVILVDQDGPLADWEGYFLEKYLNRFPWEFFVQTHKRKIFRLEDQYPERLRNKIESVHTAKGFYLNLPPVQDGIDAVKEMLSLGHDVRICTSPALKYKNCVLEKYQWIEKHLGLDFVKRIILLRDKTFVRGDFLIDDNPKIYGIYTPEWEHVVFDCPYNKDVPGKRITDWKNWKEVLGV